MNELVYDIQIFQVSPCCVFSPEENKFLIPQKVVLIHGGKKQYHYLDSDWPIT